SRIAGHPQQERRGRRLRDRVLRRDTSADCRRRRESTYLALRLRTRRRHHLTRSVRGALSLPVLPPANSLSRAAIRYIAKQPGASLRAGLFLCAPGFGAPGELAAWIAVSPAK